MLMTLTRFLPVLLLVACDTTTEPGPTFAVPAAGQTGVDREQPLVVRTDSLRLPPEYPAPEAIRVVDLSTDGFVAGTVEQTDIGLQFVPDRPWRADARYAWTIDVPEALPHGPQFSAETVLEDATVFDTSDAVFALTASQSDAGLCVVLSRPVSEPTLQTWQVDVDDVLVEEPEWSLLDPDVWEPDLSGAPGSDEGLAVACVADASGALIRLTAPDGLSTLAEVTPDDVSTLVAGLYRSTP